MRAWGRLLFASVLGVLAACARSSDGSAPEVSAESSDGKAAEGPCSSGADCGEAGICGFLESAGCSAAGQCFAAPGVRCEAYAVGCACDGTPINVTCTGLPSGYTLKPLAHRGFCQSGTPPPSSASPR